MKSFRLVIRSFKKTLFDENVLSAKLPTQNGGISIKSRYMPMLISLYKGNVEAKTQEKLFTFPLSKGTAQITYPKTTILIDENSL
ncbi:MAG: hypothetical protein ACTSXG_01160 [Alphaproteobacteria bacterium]